MKYMMLIYGVERELTEVERAESRPLTSLEQQQDADNAWALKHYDELIERYPGEYLVVWRNGLLLF